MESFEIKGSIGQKQPPEVFYKKVLLKNFAKITGKRLCQRLFLIETLAPGTGVFL